MRRAVSQNKTTLITVNNAGQPLTIKDPLNNITTLTYELGDLVKIEDPLNRETQRILDAAGRLRNVTNLKNRGQVLQSYIVRA